VAQHRAKRRVRLIVVRALICVVVIAALGAWQWNPAGAWFTDRDAAGRSLEYSRLVEQTPTADQDAMLAAATEYNAWLAEGGAATLDAGLNPLGASDTTTAEYGRYTSLLSVTGTTVMSHLSIASTGTQVPVVHGTEHDSLDASAGHLYGTSLPVGGPSTHAVIAAHSGWSRATLFNNLSQVEKGDTFTVHVVGRTLTYQVDQIEVVKAGEPTGLLAIEDGRDYVTLTTCYPAFVNTHRLLVRGTRIPTPAQDEQVTRGMGADPGFPWWALTAGGGSAAVVALAFLPSRRRPYTAEHRLVDLP
jgi:sortase A